MHGAVNRRPAPAPPQLPRNVLKFWFTEIIKRGPKVVFALNVSFWVFVEMSGRLVAAPPCPAPCTSLVWLGSGSVWFLLYSGSGSKSITYYHVCKCHTRKSIFSLKLVLVWLGLAQFWPYFTNPSRSYYDPPPPPPPPSRYLDSLRWLWDHMEGAFWGCRYPTELHCDLARFCGGGYINTTAKNECVLRDTLVGTMKKQRVTAKKKYY